MEIFDRVWGWRQFCIRAHIWPEITTGDPQTTVNYGAAHGALAMTTPGDTSMASLKEVEALVKGESAKAMQNYGYEGR